MAHMKEKTVLAQVLGKNDTWTVNKKTTDQSYFSVQIEKKEPMIVYIQQNYI